MKKGYTTLATAIADLQREGYTEDFNLCNAGVENKKKKSIHAPEDLEVVRYYRFEGMTNPADNTVLYVIETSAGEKGLLVDAYGTYSGQVPKALLEKLRIRP